MRGEISRARGADERLFRSGGKERFLLLPESVAARRGIAKRAARLRQGCAERGKVPPGERFGKRAQSLSARHGQRIGGELRAHAQKERGAEKLSAELESFRRENGWLENYALYMSLKSHFGMLSWTEWPEEDIRLHKPEAVAKYSELLRDEIAFHVFIQYLFFKQWDALRSYAREAGVSFIGDIPIYVPLDSADVWSEPRFFQLDKDNVPTEVAGVPPDDFTEDGQLWGNPLYDWDAMKADGYGWWIRRIDGAKKLYDVIRIDHFRGFESYWAVPSDETTAKNGHWKPGPGMDLVGVLTSWFHDLSFIAEDLGYTTPGVRALLADSGLPGMKVLQFAFDAHGESDFLPHKCTRNSVCYIGTHDNDTVKGWLETVSAADRKFAERYMHITPDEGWCWGMIRAGMSTVSDLFVV